MQISNFLYQKSSFEITFPPESEDPSYFLDLKEHLNTNKDYIKKRIEWRKTRPGILDMYRVKDEFFQAFCEESLPLFHEDIKIFVRNHPGLSAEAGAQMFCEKWRGYEKTYGVEFVERAIRRCSNV